MYVYRAPILGVVLKKDLWINDECLGESASDVFFYREVSGDIEYTIATESEFSPNELKIMAKSGENYFIKQDMKFEVFVGSVDLQIVDPETAIKFISNLDMAVPSNDKCQVVDPYEKPISGFYAARETTCGVHGKMYI